MANPLSPATMLATSMHAQPGVYALLLGSGVSTAAGIPTGWGIVRELVRRVAAAEFPDDPDEVDTADRDPEQWWSRHHEGGLGYSALIESLAPTSAARQALLADFFEPSDDERDEGLKTPSSAHLRVAELVKSGIVRVIVTTNFDRLMEQALEAVGISPRVVSRPEAVNGMAPLAHAPVTVIKLHGDYMDLGSRNTSAELGEYPSEWTVLLRQVLDEYGLVVSGWSADWDTALVALMEESSNRRYPLFWDSRSSKGEVARRLLAGREGRVIEATGAEEMFAELAASLDALSRLSETPLTSAMAVARLKRYLPDPVRRIDLHDLVMSFVEPVVLSSAEQPVAGEVSGELIDQLLEGHLRTTKPLLELVVTGVWFDTDGTHDDLWRDVLRRIISAGTQPVSRWSQGLDSLRLYPALLLNVAIGITCVVRQRDSLVLKLAVEVEGRTQQGSGVAIPAAQLLHPQRVLEAAFVQALPRWDSGRWLYPQSHLLQADLRALFAAWIPLDTDFTEAFHGQEYRAGLIHEVLRGANGGYRAQSGEYVGERGWIWDSPQRPAAEVAFLKAGRNAADWPWPQFLASLGEGLEDIIETHREILRGYQRWQ